MLEWFKKMRAAEQRASTAGKLADMAEKIDVP